MTVIEDRAGALPFAHSHRGHDLGLAENDAHLLRIAAVRPEETQMGVGQVSVQLAGILPKVAAATSGDDADAPLPPWALLVTGGSLLGTAVQRVRRRKLSSSERPPTVH